MHRNVGGVDRVVRVVVGLSLISLFFLLDGASRWWGVVGLAMLATAALGWCPAYLPFGIKTCKSA